MPLKSVTYTSSKSEILLTPALIKKTIPSYMNRVKSYILFDVSELSSLTPDVTQSITAYREPVRGNKTLRLIA